MTYVRERITTGSLPPAAAEALERHIIAVTKARLKNWGAWWYKSNQLEIKWSTGIKNKSPIARLIERGRVQRSGYSSPHAFPIDEGDAMVMHMIITGTLNDAEITEIRRFYADLGGSGTSAQGTCRFRAVRKLAGLASTVDSDDKPNELSKV